jgi:membrane protein DedA with SNARE-associated domain
LIDFQSRPARRVAAILFLLALLPTLWFGVRSYGSFLLLRSAYALGTPQISSVRGWMTLRYVASTYRAPTESLIGRLGLPTATDPDVTLKSLAEREGSSPFLYVQRVQRALAETLPRGTAPPKNGETAAWLGIGSDDILSALLIYGYPALALTLLLGALGLPVPTGLATTLAGSLAARGHMNWLIAGAIAVAASVIGDALGYGIGRSLSLGFLERRGRWFGFTPARLARVQALFDRFGGFTVLLTRTLVSHLSSVVSLLAGVSRYRLAGFLAFAAAGRVIWTSAYLGLGYGVGNEFEAAAGFLGNLSVLLVSLAILAASGLVAAGRVKSTR